MKCPAELSNLPPMLAHVRQAAQAAQFQSSELQQIELASEEVLVNIITHGYSPEQKGEVEVVCLSKGPRHLSITFRDQGAAFDPLKEEVPLDLEASLEERPVGGLGVYFVRALMDEVSYTRDRDTNVLTLVKHDPA